MSFRKTLVLFIASVVFFVSACGINSVTQAELEAVKPGSILTYRYRKANGEWFYADKVTRIEGDKIYYNPSKSESTKGSDARIKDFDAAQERSISKADLLKYATEQGDEKKKIIWIE